MRARLRFWWQRIMQHRRAIGVTVLTLGVAIAVINAGYRLNWTGFQGKTLWDWLNLLEAKFLKGTTMPDGSIHP